MSDLLSMSPRELSRAEIMQQLKAKRITQRQAAEALDLSVRQVKRLWRAYGPDAGAVRFLSRPDQTIVDFIGLNCHRCMGRPPDELMNEFKPDYVVFFRQGISDRFQHTELLSLTPGRVTMLGGRELVAAKVLGLPPWPPTSP